MAIDSVNRSLDENNRVSNVFSWIYRREYKKQKRTRKVD
jgi:hypothetical protein